MKQVRLEYELQARSGVMVGSTASALSIGVDKSTITRRKTGRVGKQEPLIPGSSLKGKARHECERILAGLGHAVCLSPRADTMCPHAPGLAAPCPACQIFGSPDWQARLFWSDAIVEEVSALLAPHLTRTQAGVSISRSRRVAEDERLFYLERGVSGLAYQGRVEGYLEEDKAESQLTLVLTAVERITSVGGGKSRGAGWVVPVWRKVELAGQMFSGEALQKLKERGWAAWRI